MFVWYALYTIVFTCPSTHHDITVDANHICTPYLSARDFILPHAQPYYYQHLAPYIEQVQPYYDIVNERVYRPGHAAYQTYAAPRVSQVTSIGQQQWEQTIKPQLHLAQKQAGKQYQQTLAPHVKRATDVVQPYYDGLLNSATDIWQLELEPVYRETAPYAQKAYQQGQTFVVKIALPHAQYISSLGYSFWARNIWPRIRILYGENVEPQLTRITERLGRYKDGKKLEAHINSAEASSMLSKSSVTSASSLLAASIASTVSEAIESPSTAASAAVPSTPTPPVDPAVQFKEDLKSWEEISHQAAEEGSEDLSERVHDITAQQVKSANSVGSALVTQLEATSDSALQTVQSRIQHIVQSLPEYPKESDLSTANDDLVQAVRAAGQSIKHKAQAVREFRQTWQSETESLVEKALQSTLETIDSIRELRLTEIGRKYASSSLPHKEWSKYNDLKKATHTWRNDVEKAARGHKGLVDARSAFQETEHVAMAIAEDAAKELARLKKVGLWKIEADDASDDFQTKTMPPPIRKAKHHVVEQVASVSEQVIGSSTGHVESATSLVAGKASEEASQASEAVHGSTGSVENIASQVSSSASSLSEQVIGSSTGAVESAASQAKESASSAVVGESNLPPSMVSHASSSASSLASQVSSSASSYVVGESSLADTLTDAASSVSSVVGESSFTDSVTDTLSSATESAKSVGPKLASIIAAQRDQAQQVTRGVSDSASPVISSAEDIAEAAESVAEKPKKVWGGAMAQELKEPREPVLEGDYGDVVDTGDMGSSYDSEAMQQRLNAYGESAQQAINAQYEAMKAAVATGDVAASASRIYDSAMSQASAQYDAVKSYISAQISGTPLPVQEQVLANAQAVYVSAITKASYIAYGTPITAAPLAAASSAYINAKNEASKSYASAQSRISSAIYVGTEGQELSDSARSAYSQAILSASHAIYGTPITAAPFQAASSRYSNAALEASKHYEAVKSRVSAQISGRPAPVHEKMLSSAQDAYSGALQAASSRYYSAFPTQGYWESISSVASSRLADGVSLAQQQYRNAKVAMGVQPTPAHQQYLTSAQAAYYQALGLAHGRYNEFVDAASSVIMPTPTATGYQKSIEDALSSASSVYTAYTSEASSKYEMLLDMASSAASAQSTSVGKDTLTSLQEQVAGALALAQSKLADASKSASSAYVATTSKPLASQASENWEALISKASEQVYGAPPPFTAQAYSHATEYAGSVTEAAAHATAAAAAQFEQVQALFSELIIGKEADFTASVYNRLQSAYSTGAPALVSQVSRLAGDLPSQVSSLASDSYDSISSIVSAAFTPPTQVPSILEQAQEQLNAAVNAASVQAYGTEKGTLQVSETLSNADKINILTTSQQATEAAASVYSDAASQVSEAIYGTPAPYLAAAQTSVRGIGSSASLAISQAIFGQPTPAAASIASSIQSKAAEQAASASAAIFGEEQTYLQSIQGQLSAAMASASSQIAAFGGDASSVLHEAVSTASSIAAAVTDRVRDEL